MFEKMQHERNHVAAFIDSDMRRVYMNTIGVNKPQKIYISKHAEEDAITRFMQLNHVRGKRTKGKSYNLLVIRMTRCGKFCSSRPCYHCIQKLIESGLNIKYIFYSDNDNSIKKEKFRDMIYSESHISKGYKRSLGLISW